MKIAIAGASGYIGKKLNEFFKAKAIECVPIGRKDLVRDKIIERIADCDVLINLMGESVAGYWTRNKKKKILDSRIFSTRMLVSALNESNHKINLFINASAIGIYDNKHVHTEESDLYADNYLTYVIKSWEKEVAELNNPKVRSVIIRLGTVVGQKGGIMQKFMIPFRLGIGIVICSKEAISFIHEDDVVRIFNFIIAQKEIQGIVNVACPSITTWEAFFDLCVKRFGCWVVFNIKPWVLKILLGEASVLFLNGQRIIPKLLISYKFCFKYDHVEEVINNIRN
jgi:uncharacterized protein (TIGR01777 family)